MKAIKNVSILLSAALLTAVSSVHAAMPYPFGWYLEGNIGKSQSQNTPFSGSVSNTGLGWNLNAGYKFTPYVSGEVGCTQYANVRIKNSLGATAATDQLYSYDLIGKFTLPIMQSGIELFAKLGAGRIHSNLTLNNPRAAAVNGLTFDTGTHSSIGVYWGAGAEYAVTHSLLANLQWNRVQGSYATGNTNLYSAGIAYIF